MRAAWFLLLAGGVVGVVVAALTGHTAFFDQAVGSILFAMILVPLFKVFGYPLAQPYVEFRAEGIAYGTKQFVPWSCVVSVDRVAFGKLRIRTSEWKAAGPYRWLISKQKLPLSEFDSSRRIEQWLEPFKKFAPTVRLPSNL